MSHRLKCCCTCTPLVLGVFGGRASITGIVLRVNRIINTNDGYSYKLVGEGSGINGKYCLVSDFDICAIGAIGYTTSGNFAFLPTDFSLTRYSAPNGGGTATTAVASFGMHVGVDCAYAFVSIAGAFASGPFHNIYAFRAEGYPTVLPVGPLANQNTSTDDIQDPSSIFFSPTGYQMGDEGTLEFKCECDGSERGP